MTADPNDASAHLDRGNVLAAQGRFEDAIEQFRKADELWKDQPELRKLALYRWAIALRLQKCYEQAAEKYLEALDVDPEYAAAYNGLGLVLADQERVDDAIEQFRKAVELWQKNESKDQKFALHNWARMLRLQKRYEQAAEKYLEAIGVDPEDPTFYNGLGLVLADQERFDDAIEQYRKADELWRKDRSKNRKLALCNWADALRSQKQYEQAAEKYQEAIGVDPEYAGAYDGLGVVLEAQARFDDAIEQFRKGDELWRKDRSKDRKLALYGWADALRLQKRYEQAAEKYREAIGVDPEYPNAYNGLGLVLAAQERFDEAIEQYRKADELWQKNESKDRKSVLWGWGWALLRQEHFEEAIAKYDLATKIAPKDARAVFLYGSCLTELGRYRDAIAQFDKASPRDPDDPYPHHDKGDFLFQLGRYEEGWNEWRAAWLCYERALDGELRSAEQLEMAVYFADVLREIFKYYTVSERFYQRVLERQADNANACAGLAILYQQWANSDAATPEIHARLNYQKPRAVKLLKSQLDKGIDFQTLLSLADLYIETSDWTEARERLDRANLICGESRLKRAVRRMGFVCLRSEEHAEAVKHFRQALLVKPEDLTLRSNLGNALLKSKQFEAAQGEFARVLKLAPGNIDALLGAAQVSIDWRTTATRTNTE